MKTKPELQNTIRVPKFAVARHTFVASQTMIGKAWFRNGKHYYRSPFDGKVRLVPEGHLTES